MKEGCGDIFHGYCLFLYFGGCNCDFTINQMKTILGNRIGMVHIEKQNNFGGCPLNCDKGKKDRNGFYTKLKLNPGTNYR